MEIKSYKRLAGQVALVTGASSGIGKSIAIALGREGADVVVNYHSDEKGGKETANEIESTGSKALVIGADVSKEGEVKEMFNKAYNKFNTLDILVNNAGMQKDADFVDMTFDQWQKVIDVNLTGQFLCAREAAKEFLRRGVVKGRSRAAGKIICISSVHDKIPWAGHCNYAASKGGVMLLMKTMAQELARNKIRVNSISPGAIKTSINEPVWKDPEQKKELKELIPYYRIGTPDDIASAAVWLASDESDYVTGTTLYIDGGMTLYPEFKEGG